MQPKKIPKGKVTTYKQIAKPIGNPCAVRAVGNALNKNTDPLVPCHRVIKSDGNVGGYRGDVKEKIARLRAEGIVIKKGKIDLKIFGWRARTC